MQMGKSTGASNCPFSLQQVDVALAQADTVEDIGRVLPETGRRRIDIRLLTFQVKTKAEHINVSPGPGDVLEALEEMPALKLRMRHRLGNCEYGARRHAGFFEQPLPLD